MSNVQLYLSVGLPVLAILISIAIQLQSLASFRGETNRRFDGADKRFDRLEGEMNRRFDATDKRIDKIEGDLAEMRTLFVKDFSERIARLEERSLRSS